MNWRASCRHACARTSDCRRVGVSSALSLVTKLSCVLFKIKKSSGGERCQCGICRFVLGTTSASQEIVSFNLYREESVRGSEGIYINNHSKSCGIAKELVGHTSDVFAKKIPEFPVNYASVSATPPSDLVLRLIWPYTCPAMVALSHPSDRWIANA